MIRNITCIICPRGCAMTAEITDQGVNVTGHTCDRGKEYAVAECTNPVRTVTATVRVANRSDTMVSVKTAAPVPKDRMTDVMTALRRITVHAPISIGDVILPDIFGSEIIATKQID